MTFLIHLLQRKIFNLQIHRLLVHLVHLNLYIYRNTLKTQHLILCHFLPEDQITPVIDNKMDKSDQFACIRYKNQNVLA